MSIWLIDPKTKDQSVTLTLFTVGFLIASLKLLLSGITVKHIQFSAFTGADFGMVVGSLGTIYSVRKRATPGKDT